MPQRCDYLVNNRLEVTPAILFVLACTLMFVAKALVDDADGCIHALAALSHTLPNVTSKSQQIFIEGAAWFTSHVRVFLLPAATSSATTALILANPISAQTILLNALGVTVISCLDNIVTSMFVHPRAITFDEHAVVAAAADKTGKEGFWMRHRVHACLQGIGVAVMIVYMEPLMKLFGDEQGGIGRAPCRDVTNVLTRCPLICATLVSFLDAFLNHGVWWRSKISAAWTVAAAVCGPLLLVSLFGLFGTVALYMLNGTTI